ncbi:MAG: hypothetical protein K2J15_01585 [Muribaculaceae bacterium]|nr:hypothetical protein [Muribaculaceae bacterium]
MIRTKKMILLSLMTAISLHLAGCGNKKGEYKESFTAEDWVANVEMEGYEIPGDDGDTLSADEDALSESDETEVIEIDPADTVSNPAGNASADTASHAEALRRRVAGNRIGRLGDIFNDSNHYQLEHARRLGIEPISDLRSYFHPRRPLVKVVSNEDFTVDKLSHSYPFLVPEAEQLLHDIGRNFREEVKKRGGGDYRMIVTSLLRTPVTVRKLRRVNRNATEQSTHQYATTFDIAYNKYDPVGGVDNTNYGDLKMVLAEVIEDLHQQGRCMVKYERKSPCFHITVVK